MGFPVIVPGNETIALLGMEIANMIVEITPNVRAIRLFLNP